MSNISYDGGKVPICNGGWSIIRYDGGKVDDQPLTDYKTPEDSPPIPSAYLSPPRTLMPPVWDLMTRLYVTIFHN